MKTTGVQQAKLDTVYFQLVPDDAAQTAAVLAGDADIAFWPPYEDIPAFQEAGLAIITQPSGYNEGWYFNLERDSASPGIRDLVVRKAIAMALDRESQHGYSAGRGQTQARLSLTPCPLMYHPILNPGPLIQKAPNSCWKRQVTSILMVMASAKILRETRW